MRVPGTTVQAASTQDGAALQFTTTGDVDELRARTRRMAEMHNRMHASGMGGGMMGRQPVGGGMHHGHEEMGMVPATATVEDVPGGARITLRATDPAQVPQLQAHVQEHATKMQQGGQCPMMMEGQGHRGASPHQHHGR